MSISFELAELGFDPVTTGSFLPFAQSREYFFWQERFGRKGIRFVGRRSDGSIILFLQFFEFTVKNLTILYSPLGPLTILEMTDEEREELSVFLSKLAKEQNCSFIRIHLKKEIPGLVKSNAFARRSTFTYPQHDRVVLLANLDTELRNSAKKILKKVKKEVQFEVADLNDGTFFDFINLLKDTAKKQSLRLADEMYYKTLFDFSNESNKFVDLLFATYRGKRVATVLLVRNGKNVTYLFGGTSLEGRDLGAQYFLQWSAMEMSRDNGMETYSFGGTSKDLSNPKDPLYNVSMFKQKFGGTIRDYGDVFDLVNKPMHYGIYNLYRLCKLKK